MATKKVTALVELTAPAVGDVFMIVDISEALDVDKNKKISITNIGNMIPTLANLKNVGFASTYDAGDSGTAKTIDWAANGNLQKVKITGNACDLSYTDPSKPCSLTLWLIGDGTLRTNVDADHDSDCEWVDRGEPDAYGSTNNEVIGLLFYKFDPSLTPKYVLSAVSRGAA